MADLSTRDILAQLEKGLQQKDTDGGCEANRYVIWEYEAYIEHRKFWVDSWLKPRDPRHSIWFTQTSIRPKKEGARESGSAAQAGTPDTVPPGLTMSMHSLDTAVLPGDQVEIGVTGYIKVDGRAHNQFCFEVTVTAR